MKREILENRFKIWQSLVDLSFYFALAGFRSKGYSKKESIRLLKGRWKRSFQEHQGVDLEIIKKLHGQRNKCK